MIDEYLLVYFVRQEGQIDLGKNYLRYDEIYNHLLVKLKSRIEGTEIASSEDYDRLTLSLIDRMFEHQMFDFADDELAGEYYLPDEAKYAKFRNDFLKQNVIYAKSKAIGDRFFPDAFARVALSRKEELHEFPTDLVPASDRLVRFDDNARVSLGNDADELVGELSKLNQVEADGIKELLIGNLEAGKAMILSGCARLHLLQITLLQTLAWLAKRYERETVGALAAALITALSQQLGLL